MSDIGKVYQKNKKQQQTQTKQKQKINKKKIPTHVVLPFLICPWSAMAHIL
jgi:hypothetical protein